MHASQDFRNIPLVKAKKMGVEEKMKVTASVFSSFIFWFL